MKSIRIRIRTWGLMLPMLALALLGSRKTLGQATTVTSGDFTFTLSGSVATLTGYSPKGTSPHNPAIPGNIQGRSVTTIGAGVFKSYWLSGVTIPSSVKTIQDDAFNSAFGSDNKTEIHIVIPEGVETIGNAAFHQGSNIRTVKLPKTLTTLGQYAFSGWAVNYTVNIISVTGLEDTKLKKLEGTFAYCPVLSSIELPATITEIGDNTFMYCKALSSPLLKEGVTRIGKRAFQCCEFSSLLAPKSLQTIGAMAFCDNPNLSIVELPAGLKSIGDKAFENCPKLTSITCHATTPPALEGALVEEGKELTIRVPCVAIPLYKQADGWKDHQFVGTGLNATSATLITDVSNVYVGDVIDLEVEASPKGACLNVEWAIIPEKTYLGAGQVDRYSGRFTAQRAGKIIVGWLDAGLGKAGSVTIDIKAKPGTTPPSGPVAPTGITVKALATMSVGEMQQLELAVTPTDASKEVTWAIEPSGLAMIDGTTNMLAALNPGTITVAATSTVNTSLKSNPVTITINEKPNSGKGGTDAPTGIEITGFRPEMKVREKQQLVATVSPASASSAVKWSVSPATLASVDADGMLTALAEGTITVRAQSALAAGVSTTKEIVIKGVNESLKDPTPVSSTDLTWRVGVDGRTIVVYGAEGQTLELYNLAGVRLHRISPVTLEPYRVTVPQAGVYVVRVGNASRKVVVQ